MMRKRVERKIGFSIGPSGRYFTPVAVAKGCILYGTDGNRFGTLMLEYRRHAYLQLIMDFGNGE